MSVLRFSVRKPGRHQTRQTASAEGASTAPLGGVMLLWGHGTQAHLNHACPAGQKLPKGGASPHVMHGLLEPFFWLDGRMGGSHR